MTKSMAAVVDIERYLSRHSAGHNSHSIARTRWFQQTWSNCKFEW